MQFEQRAEGDTLPFRWKKSAIITTSTANINVLSRSRNFSSELRAQKNDPRRESDREKLNLMPNGRKIFPLKN